LKENINKNKNINCENVINGIYSKLINILYKNELTSERMKHFIEAYVTSTVSEKNRKFLRVGLIHSSKWYLKKYSDGTALKKIYTAILEKTIDDLNKNLKTTDKSHKSRLQKNMRSRMQWIM